MYRMNNITKTLPLLFIIFILIKPELLKAQNNNKRTQSINGTYELIERVMVDGRVLKSPAIEGLYTLANGRFNLNLFIKNKDSTISSESTIGRYTFSNNQYCEWIDYTIRNNLDKPGLTYEAPAVTNHCTPVTMNNGGFSFSPPGESVEVKFVSNGFAAKIEGEFVDHWKKIK